MKRAAPFAFALLLIFVPGPRRLAAGTVATTGAEVPACPASLSYLGTAVQEALKDYGPSGHSEYTTCNELGPGWFKYYEPDAIPAYFGYLADLIVDTQSQFDIATLDTNPEAREHLADGLLLLNERSVVGPDGKRPLVRIMTGKGLVASTYREVTAKLPGQPPWNINVMVAKVGLLPAEAWNHTKMAIRDGCLALTGSVAVDNESEAVMELSGEGAAAARRFFESTWATHPYFEPFAACFASDPSLCRDACFRERCWELTVPGAARCSVAPGSAHSVFSLDRGRFKDDESAEWTTDLSADAAVFAAIESAEQEIVLLQRSLGFRTATPNHVPRLFRDLAEAMVRGVDVIVMMGDGTLSYFPFIWEILDTLGAEMEQVFDEHDLPPAARLEARKRLHLRHVVTHAKVYMIDRQAFYVGSQNLYPSGLDGGEVELDPNLYEQGFLVDDAGLAGEMLENLVTIWDEGGPVLGTPFALDGVYDVQLSASGSGEPGGGQCDAAFPLEIVHGAIQPPGDFECTGWLNNGQPLEVLGRIEGGFDLSAVGGGLIFGQAPGGSGSTEWTATLTTEGFDGEFSGIDLGVAYSGTFTATLVSAAGGNLSAADSLSRAGSHDAALATTGDRP